jgi:hypothetical protein
VSTYSAAQLEKVWATPIGLEAGNDRLLALTGKDD